MKNMTGELYLRVVGGFFLKGGRSFPRCMFCSGEGCDFSCCL